MKRYTFIYVIILSGISKLTNGDCTEDSMPAVGDATPMIIEEHRIGAYYCPDDKKFTDNSAIAIIYCKDGTWEQPSITCDSDSMVCSGEPSYNGYSEEASSVDGKLKVYKCPDDQQWLSGYTYSYSTCMASKWTEINDLCDDACETPRDCAEVYDLGLTTNGVYRVIPTGHPFDDYVSVYCEMTAESGTTEKWTRVMTVIENGQKTKLEYISSFGEPDIAINEDYFVGLDYLSKLSKSLTEHDSIVMEFTFTLADDTIRKATFSEFVVGEAPSYTLSSIGTYHGDAGNGLCPHVSTVFEFGDTEENAQRWWGTTGDDEFIKAVNGSFVPKKMWGPLQGEKITRIDVRMRNSLVETDVCPPMIGIEPGWTSTEVKMPPNRNIGDKISYECLGDMMYEGEMDEDLSTKTQKGVIECMADGQNKPKWNDTVILPCTIHCPTDWTVSVNGTHCYKIGEEYATSFVEAATKCLVNEGSLATIHGAEILPDADTGEYLTIESAWGTEITSLTPPLPDPTATCDSSCEVTEDNKCVHVTADDKHSYVPCNQEHNYICQMPATCPEGFTLTENGCYSVADANSFLEGVQNCAKTGATLAYPASSAMYEDMIESTIKTEEVDFVTTTFFVGNHKIDGLWETFAHMTTGDEIIPKLLPDAVEAYRTITINTDGTGTFNAVHLNDTSASQAICQFPGPIYCNEEPPAVTADMSREGNDQQEIASTLKYRCSPGYFFEDGQNSTEISVECYGFLGNWIPKTIAPCVKQELCLETIELPSNNMTMEKNEDSTYLNGTITITCPDNMATSTNGETIFNLTCQQADDGSYKFHPTIIPNCNVCSSKPPEVENATLLDYIEGKSYSVDEVINVKCDENTEYDVEETDQVYTCTGTGWNPLTLKPCYHVCGAVPEYGENVVHVEVDSKAEGAEVVYACKEGKYFDRLATTDELVNSFVMTCGKDHTWTTSASVASPYKCSDPPCPENFKLAEDGNCYMFSMEEATGILDANKRCMKDGATLARSTAGVLIQEFGEQGTKYYTTENKRAIGASELSAKLADTLTCDSSSTCTPDDTKLCTEIDMEKKFSHIECDSSINYICQYAGYCPNEYTLVNGACYKLIDTTDYLSASKTCAEDGASLARPETKLQFDNMVEEVLKPALQGSTELEALIGLSKIDSKWENDIYDGPDEELLAILKNDDSNFWRSVKLEVDKESQILTKDIEDTAPKAICQYHGPVECTKEQPVALENMKMVGENTKFVGTELTYTCDEGYFVDGNTSLTVQKISCYGSIGEWLPSSLKKCVRVEVCPTIPTVPSDYIEFDTNIDSKYLYGNISYTCSENLSTEEFGANFILICDRKADGFNFNLTKIPDCNVCGGVIPVVDGVTINGYNPDVFNISIGESVEASCAEGFEFIGMERTQQINCTKDGWSYNHTGGCEPVCPREVPSAGDGVILPDTVLNRINSELEYHCKEGLSFITNKDHPDITNTTTITCNETQKWNVGRSTEELQCVKLCLLDPPAAPPRSSNNWDNFTRSQDAEVTYTCDGIYEFGTGERTWTVNCDGESWVPEADDKFQCLASCTDAIEDVANVTLENYEETLKYTEGNSILASCSSELEFVGIGPSTNVTCTDKGWKSNHTNGCEQTCKLEDMPETSGKVNIPDFPENIAGSVIEYTCPDGLYFARNENHTVLTAVVEVTCNASYKWVTNRTTEELLCEEMCLTHPPEAPPLGFRQYNESSYAKGSEVEYTCQIGYGFGTGESSWIVTCNGSTWEPPVDGNFTCSISKYFNKLQDAYPLELS